MPRARGRAGGGALTPVRIQVTRLPHNRDIDLPRYETAQSAGVDLAAAVDTPLVIEPRGRALVPTGLAIALPAGYEAQIRPRSGLAARHGITLPNSPGTIDADYRGEIKIILVNLGDEAFEITRGMRIAQMVVAPVVTAEFEEVEALEDTERGSGGFGSTGL